MEEIITYEYTQGEKRETEECYDEKIVTHVSTWLYGRVSRAYMCSNLPMAWRERTTPRAVPYPAVAKEPVLQIVKTLMESFPEKN